MRTNARALVAVLFLGPMTTGIEAEGQGGIGNFQYGGCTNQDYNVRANSLAAEVRAKTDEGATAELDGSYAGGVVRSTREGVAVDRTGADVGYLAGAVRVGWQWRYGGGDIGGGLAQRAPDSYSSNGTAVNGGTIPFPSLSAWGGVPRYAYGWTSYGAEPLVFPLNARPPLFIGAGHEDALFDIKAGYGIGGILRATAKLHPYFQPGVDLRYLDARNWHTAFTLRLTWERQ